MTERAKKLLWLYYKQSRKIRRVSGLPPLTFKAKKAGTLKDYRIYGNTAGGESVGDLVAEGEHAGEYKVAVKVEGKNLLQNTATSQTKNGVTFTVNEDGSVTCNGTASKATWFTVNRSFDYYAPEGRIASIGNNGSMSTFYMNISYIGNVTTSLNYSSTTHQNVYVQLVIAAGYTCDNLTFYPMIRKADIEDDTYEPYHAPITTPIYLPEQIRKVGDEAEYIDYGEQKQHRVRKNLLQNTGTSRTINGVTFTVNSDGSVTCNTDENGATATAIFNVCAQNFTLASDNYILSGCPIGGDISTKYKLDAQVFTDGFESWIADIGDGANIYSDKIITILLMRIVIYKNQVCDNLTFYPMIRKADIEDDTYEPYIENTELDVALPEIPALAGTNTLTVGTEVQPSDVEISGRIKAAGGD